jgi:glycosyltransferase involved in cell wall biosynthesis
MSFRLSVIIPTYNRASLVRAAVDSALRQSVPPHEVLVCDDGSTDDTVVLLQQGFADVPKVKVLSLPHSGLPAAARNAGIAAASGEWLGFLDSDDVWLPEKTAGRNLGRSRITSSGCGWRRSPPSTISTSRWSTIATTPLTSSAVTIRRRAIGRNT